MRFLIVVFIFIISNFFVVCANEIESKENSGWQFSIGLGIHTLSFDNYIHESSNGIATSLQAGYLFENGVSVYYENNVNFYNSDYYDETFVSGITGLGLSYPLTNKLYISGLYGLAIDRSLFMEDSDEFSATGSGYGVTLGYRISDKFSIETNYMSFNLDEAETSRDDFSIDADGNAFRAIARYTF